MKKLSLHLAAALFTCAVHAQSNPAGSTAPPNTPGLAGGKTEAAAEARKARRTSKPTPKPAGDITASAESSLRTPDKAELAGARRASARDERKPGRARATQGGTPD